MIIVVPPQTQPSDGPPQIVGPPAPATAPLSWQWTSWTGQVWQLTDLSSPVLKLRGAMGVGQVDPEHWWRDVPTIEGSGWSGSRVGRGSVFLPLMVRGRDTADFLTNHSAFMQSLNPRQEGILRVTRSNGEWREIACRYESGADLTMDLDPSMTLSATYGITWATADPYWSGDPINLTFPYQVQVPFPVPASGPFVVYLNSGRSLANARLTNPGDVDSYAVWRINGPFSGFTVGVGDDVLSARVTKDVGGWIEIDTRPGYRTVLDESGADAWASLTKRAFPAVPPGEPVQLTTTVLDPGPAVGDIPGTSVEVSFPTKYRSAWA